MSAIPVPPIHESDSTQSNEINNETSYLTSIVSGWPIRILAWAIIGGVLYFGKPAFAPILFSMLIALLLSPFVDFLERHHIPRLVASLGIILFLISSLAIIVDAAWTPTQRWVENAPEVLQVVEKKIRPVQLVVARIDSITSRATTIASGPVAAPSISTPIVKPTLINALGTGRVILIDVVTIAMLTLFLLMAGSSTLRAIEQTLQGSEGHHCMRTIDSVRTELSRYYSTLAMINVCLGIATAGAMSLWGLPSPWLWGIMAGVLNFIPYIGPSVSLAVLSIVALVSFNGYATAIGVAGTFLFFATIEGQLVQPLLIGFRLNLNPIVLFIMIWLGGWFWGVAGIFLATPMLIILKEITNLQRTGSLLKALITTHHPPRIIRYRIKNQASLADKATSFAASFIKK